MDTDTIIYPRTQLVTSGGLGDAAMSLAKAHARYHPENIKITHISTHYGTENRLQAAISSFYASQGIESEVILIRDWSWLPENRHRFEAFLGTAWTAENPGDETSWEIKPFPDVRFTKVEGHPLLLSPISGGKSNKSMSPVEVGEFCEATGATLVGNDPRVYTAKNSFFNQTTVSELVNLIASADTVIGTEGFVVYFAGMCGKRVFCLNQNIDAIRKRKHPEWDFTVVHSLNEVAL